MVDMALPGDMESRLREAASPLIEAARDAARDAVTPYYLRKAKATLRARGEYYSADLARIIADALGMRVDGVTLMRAARDATVPLGHNPTDYARPLERDNDDHLDRVADAAPVVVPVPVVPVPVVDQDDGDGGCPDDCEGQDECTNRCTDNRCHLEHCLNQDPECCAGCPTDRDGVRPDCPDPDDHHELRACCGYCYECDAHDGGHDRPDVCDMGHCHECEHECE